MDTGRNIPIERVKAIKQVNFSAEPLKLLDRRRSDRISVVSAGGKIQGSRVIDPESRLAEGKEPGQPSKLGVIVLGIPLVVTFQQTGGQGEIQPGVLVQ